MQKLMVFTSDGSPYDDRPVDRAIVQRQRRSRIAESLAEVDELTAEHGVVSSERVPAVATVGRAGLHERLGLTHHVHRPARCFARVSRLQTNAVPTTRVLRSSA